MFNLIHSTKGPIAQFSDMLESILGYFTALMPWRMRT
jgi:hypothetical protein